MMNAGKSTCPVCKKEWIVTPVEDCCLPVCGCFGSDTSASNPNRPCQNCGITHALKCEKTHSTNGLTNNINCGIINK